MKEFKPPMPFHNYIIGKTVIFLGGSIEMNKAEKWQSQVISHFNKKKNVCFLNPRRDNWDNTWKQDPTANTPFTEQVTWEMDAQDSADIIVYYFDPNTISPITLLELGTYGTEKSWNSPRVIVCCPDGYFRKGNVVLFCKRYEHYTH